jgi:small subunit ribosomal protein S16
MLIIRLQRTGKKRQPEFRIVLAEKYRHASKKFLEILGNYNPRNKNFVVKNQERLDYWLGNRVELSATVHNLFVEKGILKDAAKVKAFTSPKKEVVAEEAPKAETTAPAEEAATEEQAPAEAPVEAAPEVAAEEPDAETPVEAGGEVAESEGVAPDTEA